MSRIGKQPITVPSAVKVDIDGTNVKVTGPRGSLSRDVVPEVRLHLEDGKLIVVKQRQLDKLVQAKRTGKKVGALAPADIKIAGARKLKPAKLTLTAKQKKKLAARNVVPNRAAVLKLKKKVVAKKAAKRAAVKTVQAPKADFAKTFFNQS